MYSVSIDAYNSQEKDKTHQILLFAHPSSLYDMRHRPSTQWGETLRLGLGRIVSPRDVKGKGRHTEDLDQKSYPRSRVHRQLRPLSQQAVALP
jgi:hypothetical protein